MRVIHIIDNLSQGGGVGSFVFDLCLALQRQRIDVSLIGIIKTEEGEQVEILKKAGISVYCLNAPDKKEAILSYVSVLKDRIIEIAGNEQAVCNLHLKLSVLLGGIATKGLKNIRCVETYHSQYSHYLLEYNLMKSRISKYICCSDSAKKEFITRFHPQKEKVVSIPNGIDVKTLHERYADLNPQDGITRLISVGRFTNQKNIQVTAEAFSNMCNEKLIYNIVGEGPYKEQIIDATKGNHYIRILETMPREQVMREVGRADVVVMPSLWEGLSIFMLEALSLGKVMMLSDIPSFRGVVNEKKLEEQEAYRKCSWGYLVKNKSGAFAKALNDLINHSTTWDSMKKNSYFIAQNYNIDNTATGYIALYKGLDSKE